MAAVRQIVDGTQPPKPLLVKTRLCKFNARGACRKGPECPFAHDESELKSAPDLRCTKLCKEWQKTGDCKTAACSFAHGKSELRRITNQPAEKKEEVGGRIGKPTPLTTKASIRESSPGASTTASQSMGASPAVSDTEDSPLSVRRVWMTRASVDAEPARIPMSRSLTAIFKCLSGAEEGEPVDLLLPEEDTEIYYGNVFSFSSVLPPAPPGLEDMLPPLASA